MADTDKAPTWKTLGAFAIIYFVWGSTFLAIRFGVEEVPPFLLAAIRFTLAGAMLFGWALARRERWPSRREWGSALLLGVFVFVVDYGLVFWAERRVPSGITAVLMATIPSFMAISEILILRTQRFTLRLVLALLVGLAGVAVLVAPWPNLHDEPVDRAGAVALVFAAMGWSVGAVLTKKLPLPASKVMSSGSQMLAGGLLLALTALALGEHHGFSPAAVSSRAWLSLAYLVIPGSIIAYTVFLWLIQHETPTRVGTYAYVNPVVAVLLGYFAGGEPLGLRTLLGTMLVLVSVVLITVRSTGKPATRLRAAKAAWIEPGNSRFSDS